MVCNIAYPATRVPFDLFGKVGKKTFPGRGRDRRGPLLAG